MNDSPALTVMLVPEGGRQTRSFQLSSGRLRMLAFLGTAAAILLGMMAGSWWYLAARAGRVERLEAEVTRLRAEQAQFQVLSEQLEDLEARYSRLREMFGQGEAASGLWLPPSGVGSEEPDVEEGDASLPTSWPLTERGFVTQTLLANGEEHPGIDVAVPSDSYVRAAGAGLVAEVGEDPIYGKYVVLEHSEGYTSRYAHASHTFVEAGRRVRRNEVIALSGSTGRSTAPHLHFEILQDGAAVDPLTLVRPPS